MKFNIQRFGNDGPDPYSRFYDMTSGIKKQGIDHVYQLLHTKLEKDCKEALENNIAFVRSLREYWIGDDREVFIANLQNAVKKVEEKWEECDGLIKNEFDKIKTEWEEFEKTNVVQK